MGRFAEAVADLDKAIELDPFDDWAFLSRGDAFLELGEAERALADYGQVIELEPENPAGYSHRRDALLDLGRRDDALADIEIALRLAPDTSDNYVRRGIVLVDQGPYPLAQIHSAKAIALHENNTWAPNNFGHHPFTPPPHP